MRHLESNDVLSVTLDEYSLSKDGILLSKAEAILEGEQCRRATVFSVPETYTLHRTRDGKELRIQVKSPVKVGDRVVLDKFAGITMYKHGDQAVAIVRMHEIVAVLEDETQAA